ncbi:DNA repair XRCC3-like protein [Chlorella sorokiniana]|uniref:DNA repair XRCC3-like protein n=1 Tax=Chlorella sorokiniana TaxID=3076 RepID=A0A2P6TQJ5_CHLSO|nr:DNA repair XRCC3-like protein [Chlorella sorokiniana]|eukprot:PRW56306.1 DNA repair XRCC3-like protein [Chlorella sorokiniana]
MTRPLQPRPLALLPTAKLSTGCPQLDAVLDGGLPVGSSLTEVAGEAAASKTQLSLQLLLSAQLPQQYGGLDGAAVYVYTEGEPAMRRLHQLARWLHLRYPPEALAALPDPTANIFVEKGIDNGSELLRRLQRLRGLLDQQRRAAAAARAAGSGSGSGGTVAGRASGAGAAPSGCTRPVRLLVVDSVAHVLRDMGDSVGASELAGRTELLFKISALLRRYADEYGLAVLLVNQIVDSVTDSRRSALALPAHPRPAAKNTGHTGSLRLVSLGREVVPALGLAWANCVNTRLFLSRCATFGGSEPARYYGAPSAAAQAAAAAGDGAAGGSAPALRKLQIVFSPHLPQRECYYVVEATGVRGLADEELQQHEAAAAQAAWREEQQRQQAVREQDQQWWQQQQAQQQQQQAWQQHQGDLAKMTAEAKQLLATTSLAEVLPTHSLVSVTTGCRMEAAIKTLHNHRILSCPVMAKGEYHGCISVNDVLKNLMGELSAQKPHWLEQGAAVFSADDLVAAGKALSGKSVGELEHAGSLFLLNAQSNTSMLDFVNNSFDIKDNHHVHHRVYVCMPAGSAHIVSGGATTVVNATTSQSSGKLSVTHVVSHLDVIRLLAANKDKLGGMAEASLEALGLDEGAVFCVPASTPALEAFGRMAIDQKSSLGLTDASGKLVGNLSASDLRGLTTPEAFAALLKPAAEYQAAQAGVAVASVATVTPATTFGALLDMLVAHKFHRAYVVDAEGKPTSIITLTDILRKETAQAAAQLYAQFYSSGVIDQAGAFWAMLGQAVQADAARACGSPAAASRLAQAVANAPAAMASAVMPQGILLQMLGPIGMFQAVRVATKVAGAYPPPPGWATVALPATAPPAASPLQAGLSIGSDCSTATQEVPSTPRLPGKESASSSKFPTVA